MANDSHPSESGGWLETSGLLPIFRTLGMAIQPAKLGIALAAIIATFALGGILDWFWTVRGGVGETAVVDYIMALELDQTYDEPEGDSGIFNQWREHEQRCMLGLFGSSLSPPGVSAAADTPLGGYAGRLAGVNPCRNLKHMAIGVCWMFRCHLLYFIFFAVGSLAIWSVAGGAICRIAAVQFARGEQLTVKQGLAYSRKEFGSFFLAPCLPVLLILMVMLFMVIGGLVLRIPWIGDVICGIAFVLALIGGFVIAALLLGLLVGGNLFWPTVATEGTDVFDSFSRSLPYAFFKPWKTVFYAVVTLIYGAVCWVFVHLFTYLTLSITRAVVSFGTSPFGWFARGDEENPISKLDLLWPPIQGPNALYTLPEGYWERLGTLEHVSAVLIAFWVLLVIALMWSFLASYYYSACTVIYFLLRRDVDGTDLGEVCVEEEEDEDSATFDALTPKPAVTKEPHPQPAKASDASGEPAAQAEPAAKPAAEGQTQTKPTGEAEAGPETTTRQSPPLIDPRSLSQPPSEAQPPPKEQPPSSESDGSETSNDQPPPP